MFHKSLQKAQMDFPVVTASLTYVPAAAILFLKSLNMITQEAPSAYTADIPDPNEYLLESHDLMVQNTTRLFLYHYMSPVSLAYLSPNTSRFPTPLPSDIQTQGPTSVTTYTHMNSTSDLP